MTKINALFEALKAGVRDRDELRRRGGFDDVRLMTALGTLRAKGLVAYDGSARKPGEKLDLTTVEVIGQPSKPVTVAAPAPAAPAPAPAPKSVEQVAVARAVSAASLELEEAAATIELFRDVARKVAGTMSKLRAVQAELSALVGGATAEYAIAGERALEAAVVAAAARRAPVSVGLPADPPSWTIEKQEPPKPSTKPAPKPKAAKPANAADDDDMLCVQDHDGETISRHEKLADARRAAVANDAWRVVDGEGDVLWENDAATLEDEDEDGDDE